MKQILNQNHENIDYIISGNTNSSELVIFTHGFGTNKNEGFNLFKELSENLDKNYLCLRYDLTGYGNSDGTSESFNLNKASLDLKTIINFCKNEFPDKKINLVSHSIGTYITSILSPNNINNVIFTAPPNSNSNDTADRIKKRIEKNSKVDEFKVSDYLRTSGQIQKIGTTFWSSLRELDFLKNLKILENKTNLSIILPLQDDIITHIETKSYKDLEKTNFFELNGDHNFSKNNDRKILINTIKNILDNS
jgi:pimeloyl-ACP methyl ester carboxylesterase